MFYQTDPDLNFNANSDCYLFDILKIHELVGKHRFTRDDIKDIRKVAVRVDFISEDGFLNEKGVSGVAMVASGLTGHHVYIKRVGSNDYYTHIIAKYERPISNSKPMHHFVLANMAKPLKLVDWDPWSKEGARTTREGYAIGLRYIFAEVI